MLSLTPCHAQQPLQAKRVVRAAAHLAALLHKQQGRPLVLKVTFCLTLHAVHANASDHKPYMCVQRMPTTSAFPCTISLVNKLAKLPCLAPYSVYLSGETSCTELCDGSLPSGNRYLNHVLHGLSIKLADFVAALSPDLQ